MMPELQLLPSQFQMPNPTLLEDIPLEQKLFRTKFDAPKNEKMTVMMPEVQSLPSQFPMPNQTLLEDIPLKQKLFRTKFVAPKK
jgi:hypothetical protein